MGCKLCMMAQYGVESWFKKTTFQPKAANRNSHLQDSRTRVLLDTL